MLALQNEINDLINQIPQKYLVTILEYTKLMRSKAEKGEPTDTEYIESIPGYSEMIIREANKDSSQYSEKLDW